MGVGYEECDTELGLGMRISCGKNSPGKLIRWLVLLYFVDKLLSVIINIAI